MCFVICYFVEGAVIFVPVYDSMSLVLCVVFMLVNWWLYMMMLWSFVLLLTIWEYSASMIWSFVMHQTSSLIYNFVINESTTN